MGVCFGRPTFGFGRAGLAGAAAPGSESFGSLRERDRLDCAVRGLPMTGFRIAES